MEPEREEGLYAVSIKGNGIAVEKSVSADVARRVINALMGGSLSEVAGSDRPIDSVTAVNLTQRRVSIREFIEESNAKRSPDKIITIGEYLFRFEGSEIFTREDIRGRYRLAGEATPANFPRDFAWAIRNGWVAEDPKSPGSFYVTQKGRNAIESKFSAEVKKGTPQPTARRRSRNASGMRTTGK